MWHRLFVLYWKNIPGPKTLVLVMSFLVSISHGLLLSIINSAIDNRMNHEFDASHFSIFIFCMLIFVVGSYFTIYKTTAMVGYFTHRLRTQIIDKITLANLKSMESYARGQIFTHLTKDVSQLASTALESVGVFKAIILITFCVIYLTFLSLPVVIVTLFAIVIGVSIYFWQEGKAKRWLEKAREQEAGFLQLVIDKLDGFKELKINDARNRGLVQNLVSVSDDFRANHARSEFIFFAYSLISQLALFTILALFVFTPANWFSTDSSIIFKIVATLLFMLAPLERIVDFIGPLSRASVAYKRIEDLELLLERSAENLYTGPETTSSLDGPIMLKGLEHSYLNPSDQSTFSTGPLDLKFGKGEITFICGGNGSGKTTLLKLLTGLYLPEKGVIVSNGKEVKLSDVQSYRNLFSVIFSDYHLFKTLFGMTPIPKDRISNFISKFGLSNKTKLVENRYESVLLSTGQQKRLALVTVLAEDRPVIVLDEFAADQDPEFRRYF